MTRQDRFTNLRNVVYQSTSKCNFAAVLVAELVKWALQNQFESSHRQFFSFKLYWKDENKEKEADSGTIFKNA